MVKSISESQWHNEYEEDVLNHNLTVAVIFTAEWCDACHILVDKLDRENFNVDILQIDTDQYPELPEELEVTTLPTIAIYQHGDVIDLLTNSMRTEDIISVLKELR